VKAEAALAQMTKTAASLRIACLAGRSNRLLVQRIAASVNQPTIPPTHSLMPLQSAVR
jgi:hypothetical protein